MGWDEETVDFLLSPSLGAVDNERGGEMTDDLAVEGDEAGDVAEL